MTGKSLFSKLCKAADFRTKSEGNKEHRGNAVTPMNDNELTPTRLTKPVKLWQLIADEKPGAQQKVIHHPTDVASLGMYTFAVADSVGHRILIIDIARNICSTIAEGQIWPNGVAVSEDSKLLVTDRKEKVIKTYDLRGDLLSIWDPGEEILVHPHGIAITSRGETVVTDTGTNSAFIFSPKGDILRKFGSKGNLLQQLHLPFYCAVNRRDQILISDNMNYCVKIFDTRGNFLGKIGTGNTFSQRQFQCPYGLSTDPWTDEILVADYDGNKIFTFGTDGKFLGYAVQAGSEGVENPTGVAVGPCGVMVVTECSPDGGTNVKAFRLYESRDGNHNIEKTWTSRTESAV